MNNGKICVSVCAGTSGEFIKNIDLAAEYADIIELRFDCLDKEELANVLSFILKQKIKKPLLATFRPSEEGGKHPLSLRDRIKFWEAFFLKHDQSNFYADIELSLQIKLHLKSKNLIISSHDFSNAPPAAPLATYEALAHLTDQGILKIAVQTDEITDSIAVWKLLEKARKDGKQIIPIAMGEGGKWTRILGPAHGAFMTYASLDSGKETASGQLTAKELIETYRVKEINKNTEIYGIIGNPVSQSVSPVMHNTVFRLHNIDAVFIPFEIKNLDGFIEKFVKKETREIELNFKGFSVTIPHKQAIIKHLDEIDETAKAIGAVNTVKIENGRLTGYNTDAPGFIEPLKTAYGDLRKAKVAVLGAGGSARAVCFALKNEMAEITIFARNMQKAESLASEFNIVLKELPDDAGRRTTDFNDFDILVNTTPLGMKGKLENMTPVLAEQIKNLKLVCDLVYNPFQTLLMKEADKVNVPKIGGLAMLVAQAMEQQKIWTGLDAPMQEMSRAAISRLR